MQPVDSIKLLLDGFDVPCSCGLEPCKRLGSFFQLSLKLCKVTLQLFMCLFDLNP
eukprot:XP_001708515.1 Hypothetical protein GL50803_35753 [Giardia lamblia ATCC 50803]